MHDHAWPCASMHRYAWPCMALHRYAQQCMAFLPPPRKGRPADSDSDQSPPRNKTATSDKMSKTLDGKRAGLQRAADLKDELEHIRSREKKMFQNMDTNVSGR